MVPFCAWWVQLSSASHYIEELKLCELSKGVYVLFRTHLAKIKCFNNLCAEDGLEVNVVLKPKAQPSALRNREAIRVHQQ